MKLSLPPAARRWSTAASAAAAISYADRGASAIAASSLLDELRWTEGQLGEVQSAFFVGYAATQVLGGVLGGAKGGGYRSVVPLSLLLTGVATLLFPLAATMGPNWASFDRFCLGLMEGVLLPSAMAGVSATTTALGNEGDGGNKATASAIVIAGCYLGSAWAYLSAWLLFSERFQLQMVDWGYSGSVWPSVFYLNGIISMLFLLIFREEFDLFGSFGTTTTTTTTTTNMRQSTPDVGRIWEESLSVVRETLASQSGRAIVAAQVGQGALLYSIASWGPLYLERVNAVSSELNAADVSAIASPASVSPVAVAASVAASSLILPQITQALVGVSIGAGADQLSSNIGTRTTRRALQTISGVCPAIILWYLAQSGSVAESELLSPAFLFGTAQTVSALSLGAVSVSHLDIANPSTAGGVYALGNVAAAASGSIMVNAFGRLLEEGGSGIALDAGGSRSEFALPFRAVAVLSAAGSLFYGCTVDTKPEIGINGTTTTAKDRII
ncbi:hypothetical protein ACHAXT_009007 [Thalassiosira profunda]